MSNRLAASQSPYLLQHAENPVDWYEWGEEAFEKAHAEDKPVFLSIGYSTCHWCHVMAHESFEDQEVADLLNAHFISVKVDREERPDVDRIYMEVCQALTGHGGWPLTVVMDFERRPFFAGTYFPKAPVGDRHGMLSLLPLLAKTWKNQRGEILDSAESILVQLASFQSGLSPSPLAADLFQKAQVQFKSRFDAVHGGFGNKPKFPTPYNLNFLIASSTLPGHSDSRDMAVSTLRSMRSGGIYDQLGFGFHRYSTDREWLLPHFEKMLYDQALHVLAYTEAWECTRDPLFKRTAEEILTYVDRDLKDVSGGFYSAEDADSEGEEGKFYFWTTAEIRSALPPEEAELWINFYGMQDTGNFSEEHSGIKTTANILHLKKGVESPLEELSRRLNQDIKTLHNKMEVLREKLTGIRSRRIRPFLDDKILTDWNGLMIAAFSKAARTYGNDTFKKTAEAAVSFLFSRLTQNGFLVKRFRQGVSGLAAHLDDYAFVIFGLLELYQSSFDESLLDKTLHVTDLAISLFWEEEKGAFYFTSGETDELPIRSMEFYDGAIPSGNAVMAWNLVKLSRLFNKPEWEEMARRIGEASASTLNPHPINHGFYLRTLLSLETPYQEVTLVGQKSSLPAFLEVLRQSYHPNRIILFKDTESTSLSRIFALSTRSAMTQSESGMNAYLCEGNTCQAPVSSAKELAAILGME